jgi:ribosomal protein S12 methylthiotransferase
MGQGVSIGRSCRDAPQVDGLVFVQGEIPAGSMVKVRIESAMVYDLNGRPYADTVLRQKRLKTKQTDQKNR